MVLLVVMLVVGGANATYLGTYLVQSCAEPDRDPNLKIKKCESGRPAPEILRC